MARFRDAFPVTSTGLALLALAAGAFWFLGVKRLDLILLAASVLLAVLLAGLLAATLLTALFLRRRLAGLGAPLHLESGAWSATGFRVPLPRWLPFMTAATAWTAPGDLQARLQLPSGAETVQPGRRALRPGITRRITLGDALGLTALSWTHVDPTPVRILPQRAPLDPRATILGLIPGGEDADPFGEPLGDPVDIRKYGHGDPMRMILWKVYARTRKAFVRIPERATAPAPRLCAYLPANPGDEPPARLARTLLERGLLGAGWRFGADGGEDAHTLPEALEALARSGSTEATGGLGPFLDRARRDGFGTCFLLLPCTEGPWLAQLQPLLAAAPLPVHLMFALDGWASPPPPALWRLLLRPPPQGGATPAALLALLNQLAPPAMATTLVDVRSGDVLESPRAYLRKRAGTAA